ncbi:oxidoreductase [Hylemonella gracilis str. Niagara R]|uniref:Oxidoreductase n=1 Tax=Hylemonella gracilis str. Niagara R TaxID=1458275 RepID=A0A016XG60_9BURK|nr:FAD-dependent oxidoreductase [Hylemonella gracilis]EYC50203.1 oxidoreductase [Hylemonella gracilis str. Niagara R]
MASHKPLQALIVGGGIGGMSAAIQLSAIGHEVDLIDLDPHWRVYGAGISITGPTLRAFKSLGILDQVRALAFTGDGIQVCDAQGRPLHIVPTPIVTDEDIPGSGGIMRPLLHRILSEKTRAAGAKVGLGLTVDQLESDAEGVNVLFSDGRRARYDLVIGADGVYSRVRGLLFPAAPGPVYTGQCVWRVTVPRPPEVTRRMFFLGGPLKVGLTPVSGDRMYMFALETGPKRPVMRDAELLSELRRLLKDYGGIVGDVRDGLSEGAGIVLRPLEGFLLPRPWELGRVILIGDAAHPTTPQLASGAGLAVEDALVLGEELGKHATVEQAYAGFMARRYERCRLVVENSLEIGRREQTRAPIEQQAELVEQSLRVLAAPI